jgi:transposase-like protein
MKKTYTPKQKASIALAAIRGEKISKLASDHEAHPNVIGKWKKLLEAEASSIFSDKRKKENYSQERLNSELKKIIGQRDIEIEWLKKKSNLELPREISFD